MSVGGREMHCGGRRGRRKEEAKSVGVTEKRTATRKRERGGGGSGRENFRKRNGKRGVEKKGNTERN